MESIPMQWTREVVCPCLSEQVKYMELYLFQKEGCFLNPSFTRWKINLGEVLDTGTAQSQDV